MANLVEDAEIVTEAVAEDSFTSGVVDMRSAVASLNDPTSGFYSTIKANTFKERLALGKAINDSIPLDTVLGTEFELANYIVQVVEIADNGTGETVQAARTILIDDKGVAYHGTSKGLMTAIRNLNATVGDPSQWEGNTVRIKVVMEGVRPRQYFTIKFI
jgi:hypothetical protein